MADSEEACSDAFPQVILQRPGDSAGGRGEGGSILPCL